MGPVSVEMPRAAVFVTAARRAIIIVPPWRRAIITVPPWQAIITVVPPPRSLVIIAAWRRTVVIPAGLFVFLTRCAKLLFAFGVRFIGRLRKRRDAAQREQPHDGQHTFETPHKFLHTREHAASKLRRAKA